MCRAERGSGVTDETIEGWSQALEMRDEETEGHRIVAETQ